MNLCIVIGKVLDEPELKFLYQSKMSAISYFNLELRNGSIIRVYGYDDIADFIYQKIKKNDILNAEGKVSEKRGNLELEVTRIEILKSTENYNC